jgi:hypothetical protein
MAQRSEIEAHRAAGPAVDSLQDYGPNGLQVAGRAQRRHGVSGVTTRLAATFGPDHPFIVIDNPA